MSNGRLVGLLLVLLVPTPVWAQAGGPTEWSKLVDAAKKEGKVAVSIPASADLRRALDDNFKKRFPGIELELVVARGPSHEVKIVQEKRATLHNYDLHIAGTSSIFAAGFLKDGLVEPLLPWLILPEVRDAKNW